MASISEQAMKLLDFNQKLDITLLDSIVGCMYSGIGEQVRVDKAIT
jgi:exportin-1